MKKLAIQATVFLAVFGHSAFVWAQQAEPYYRRHMMGEYGWFGWLMGPVMMLVFLAIATAVIVLVVRALGGFSRNNSVPTAHTDAVGTLKERFARGEIDTEEFEEKRKILGE